MIIQDLEERKLISPPKWLADNCAYITIMGSQAYGVSDGKSDEDLYGFCFPPKELVFPHLAGEITGFGAQLKRFEVWQQHHIKRLDNHKEYDFSIYSIVKFFQLCMENNPNMIDTLFTPDWCVKHRTEVAGIVLENRKLFLHKGAWFKFKGYAYSQVHKMKIKNPVPGSKRFESIQKFGFDVKFAYHTVRLLSEIEQILVEGDLDLTRNREQLKAIRRGEWTEQQVMDHFTVKEKELESLYLESKLPHSPNEKAIKQLLLNCLEHHYGDLSKAVHNPAEVDNLIKEIERTIEGYKK